MVECNIMVYDANGKLVSGKDYQCNSGYGFEEEEAIRFAGEVVRPLKNGTTVTVIGIDPDGQEFEFSQEWQDETGWM